MLMERLAKLETINEPVLGTVSMAEFMRSSMFVPDIRWQEVRLVNTAAAAGRVLEEYLYIPGSRSPTLPEQISQLPVSIVFDGQHARLYSAHELVPSRAPILEIDPSVEPVADDNFLGGYFDCLHRADLDGTLSMFETDGYMQHSNGHRYPAPDKLREDFISMFANNGGRINVRFCSVMDDGIVRSFECYMPSGRPAIATYQRGATGRIAAIRICL
jgi:hypothetical protein